MAAELYSQAFRNNEQLIPSYLGANHELPGCRCPAPWALSPPHTCLAFFSSHVIPLQELILLPHSPNPHLPHVCIIQPAALPCVHHHHHPQHHCSHHQRAFSIYSGKARHRHTEWRTFSSLGPVSSYFSQDALLSRGFNKATNNLFGRKRSSQRPQSSLHGAQRF